MENKVIVVLVDGMRPDGIQQCGESFLEELAAESTASFSARTVYPSMTLPCHTSLFFSVEPERHGVLTNDWRPMARPIDSIGDATARYYKKAAMFYNWEQLRDLNRPGSLHYSHFESGDLPHEEAMEREQVMTGLAIDYIQRENPDFVFLYLGHTDHAGHEYGWMTQPYLEAIANASQCIRRVKEALCPEYHLIVTADHGGHDRDHGSRMAEDMTIPMIFHGPSFAAGEQPKELSIKDIAPTVASLLGMRRPPQWEGKSLL